MARASAMRVTAVVLVALALVSAAVCGAVLALFTPGVFDLLAFHPVALDYMSGRIGRIEMSQLTIEGQSFGAAEIDHLDDVAVLLDVLAILFVVSLAIFLTTLFARPGIARRAGVSALAGLLGIGGLTVAAYLVFGFIPVGEAFHEVLFPQGNWRFPWYSLIIRLYGTEVMVTGAGFVIMLALAGVVSGLVAAILASRRGRSEG